MATENRSSNTEMVSELLPCPFCNAAMRVESNRDWHRAMGDHAEECVFTEPETMMVPATDAQRSLIVADWNRRAQQAQQPHPDPIAWMVGTAIWWTKEEAERDAAETGLPIVGLGPMAGVAPVEQHQGEPVASKKIHIEVRECESCNHIGIDDAHGTMSACHECEWSGPEPVEDKCPGCERENCMAASCPDCGSRYVLATSKTIEVAAEPAEVERLREVIKHSDAQIMRQSMRISNQRAQLAEAQALLRDRFGGIRKLAEKACGRPKDSPEYRSLLEAINPTMLLDLTAVSASAEPGAPVEIDERVMFEKAVIDKAERFHPELRQYGDQPDAEYRDANIEWAWGLWQARAALGRKQ